MLRRLGVSLTHHVRSLGTAQSSSSSNAVREGARRWVTAPRLVAGGLVLCAGSAVAAVNNDEGLRRSWTFWKHMGPIYAHYRAVEFMVKDKPEEEQDRAYEKLHDMYAQVVLDVILMLRGFYIKIGQVGATRADFVPQQYIQRFETLQDQVPAEDFEYVRKIVEGSLKRPLEDMFSFFDPRPIGSASIGQAHRATLKDGRQVVVKVKYPSVEATFNTDMETITDFCRLAQPEHVPFLKEIKKQFMTEFDYRKEAESLQQVRSNIMPHFPQVVIPEPVMELCSRDVLVMEFLPGVKLIDGLKKYFGKLAKERGVPVEVLREEMIKKYNGQGPPAWKIRMYSVLVQSYAALVNSGVFLYNSSAGWFTKPLNYHSPEVPLNIPEILQLLSDVHVHQVLFDGLFNGDPHPGNILLMPDGRLGLIDYGQVKALPVGERVQLAKMIIALAEDDEEEVIRLHKEMGFVSERMDPYVVKMAAVLAFDRDDRKTTQGMNLQQFFEHLGHVDKILHGADEFVMVSRLSILLRGMGTHLAYPLRTAVAWRKAAEEFLAIHGSDKAGSEKRER